jgi:exonuclease SbcC
MVSRLEGQLAALAEIEDVTKLRATYGEKRAEAEKLPSEIPAGREAEDVRQAISGVRAQRDELRATISRAESAAERKTAAEATITAAEAEAASEARRESALTLCAKAFSRNGIPAMILDNAVGSIEVAANEVLDELGVEMSIQLVTQREKKSGGLTETLDVVVDDGEHQRPVESFSGGEQYRVHIALRLALARTLGGGLLDFLLIDEPTDLDAAGLGALASLIAGMPQQVLLVTHQDDLVASLPEQIVVGKEGAASRVGI